MGPGGGIDAGIPKLAETPLLIAPVPVGKMQGTGNGLLAAFDGCAVALLKAFSGLSDFLMLFVGGNAAFDSHALNSQLLLQGLGLGPAESSRPVQTTLAAGALFLQKVIKPGMTVHELTGLGNSDALFGAAVGLHLWHNKFTYLTISS